MQGVHKRLYKSRVEVFSEEFSLSNNVQCIKNVCDCGGNMFVTAM